MSNTVCLKRKEAAERLGVGLTTVDRLIAAGEIPAYKMTGQGSTRIKETDLEAYIESCRIPVTAPAAKRRRKATAGPSQERKCWYQPGMKVV